MDDHVETSSGEVAMPCICGDPRCENNSLDRQACITRHHNRSLHGALKSQDCFIVSQLLQMGMQFCSGSEDNCYVHIVKHCSASFLDSALKIKPDAVNVRGPGGLTLLMLCDSVEKMQVLLKYGPDVDAVNQEGENVLLHFVKHTLWDLIQKIIDSYRRRRELVRNLVDECKTMFQNIVQCGVNVNCEDNEGRTALEVVLNLFKSGFVIHDIHYVDDGRTNSFRIHDENLCIVEHDIAAHLLSTLLEIESVIIPAANQHGITALMLACLDVRNEESIQLLVQRGVDVNERDEQGHNAIHHLLQSFVDHYIHDNCGGFEDKKPDLADKILCFLLDSGCQIQGTEILIHDQRFNSDYDKEFYSVLVYLMAIKDSYLNERDFAGKQALKNSQRTLSFLQVLLMLRESDGVGQNTTPLDLEDVDLLAKEIADGLDVRQRLDRPWDFESDQSQWSHELRVPDALRKTVYMQVTVTCALYPEPPEEEELREPEYFEALDGIQRLLLPFWPHPPMALMIFAWFRTYLVKLHADQCKRQLQCLYDIGGPLNRGSKLYHATRHEMESAVRESPDLKPVLDMFDALHVAAGIPSLLHMSRTALRASLTEVDTKGLDYSHLKVWCQGQMRSLPTPIVEYLNFGKVPPKPAVGVEEPETRSVEDTV